MSIRLLILGVLISSFSSAMASPQLWPKIDSHIKKDPAIEKRVQEILSSLSLEQKVGQMMQAEIKFVTPQQVKDFHLGSVLNGGGSFPNNNKYAKVSDWVALADKYYQASLDSKAGIPIIWGTDAVHGHNNVFGATVFPHNIGLGATQNTELLNKIGRATALEVLATGLDWIFAPTVAVVRNDRWGRTYEGYSEDPRIVKDFAAPMIFGMQGSNSTALDDDHLVSTVKHFVGDGGTVNGVDQGDNRSSEEELIRLHAQGYFTGLTAGAQTVMASFNSWNGDKVHGNHYLLTQVLKERMGFDGFVVGDWNGHGQVEGCSNSSCAKAINAGVDMIMVPEDWQELIKNTIDQVQSGEISMKRIDDAVTRILRVKLRTRLYERGLPSKRKHAGKQEIVGRAEHRKIARQAVRESLVLLKNKNNILPLDPTSNILVTGSGADNIGKQSGGWTLTWQGTGNLNSDFPGATSIFDGIEQAVLKAGGKVELSHNGDFNQRPDVAVVVFGETPYAEGQGDIQNLLYSWKYPQDLELLKSFKDKGIPVVSIFLTGRPLWMNQEINQSDAFVAAWLPGSEGVGIADVILKKDGKVNYDFKGKLSFSWPNDAASSQLNIGDEKYEPLFEYAYGLTYADTDTLGDDLSEEPFPTGSNPAPKDRVGVFKGRTLSPFVNYVGDSGNWKYLLRGDVGESAAGLVSVIAIDKDVQEDARQVYFHGGDSNYYFQADSQMNISEYVKSGGVLKFDIRVDQFPDHEANILMGLGKMNFNHYLNNAQFKQWKTISIKLDCFEKKGTDFSNLNMPFSLATFGSMKLSIANIEILAKASSEAEEIECKD